MSGLARIPILPAKYSTPVFAREIWSANHKQAFNNGAPHTKSIKYKTGHPKSLLP